MILTPTGSGAMIAGTSYWSLLWSFLFKVEHFPILRRFIKKDKVFNWINNHKAESLILTETINLGTHSNGGPVGVLFAIGGTLVNIVMIFIVLPLMFFKKNRKVKVCIA